MLPACRWMRVHLQSGLFLRALLNLMFPAKGARVSQLVVYLATLVVFTVVDFVWLGFVAYSYYRSQIGHLMGTDINLPAAVAFYLVYALGLFIFVVQPAAAAGGPGKAFMMGAMFGFFCYATYDLTNLATLKNWPVTLSLVDMAWGAVLSGIAAAAGAFVAQKFA
jgi:uncharacterized membrane protein